MTRYSFFNVPVRHILFFDSNPIPLLPTLASLLSHPSAISCLSDCQQRWKFIIRPDGTLHSWSQTGVIIKCYHNISITKKYYRNMGDCKFGVFFWWPLGFVIIVIWLLFPKSNLLTLSVKNAMGFLKMFTAM